jgi:hypothetical protein
MALWCHGKLVGTGEAGVGFNFRETPCTLQRVRPEPPVAGLGWDLHPGRGSGQGPLSGIAGHLQDGRLAHGSH